MSGEVVHDILQRRSRDGRRGDPGSRGDIVRIKADSVADDGAAVSQTGKTVGGDGGVVPDDEGVGPADLVIEIRVAFAELAAHLGRVADHGTFD